MRKNRQIVGVLSVLGVLGCGGAQGTRPEDMSAEQHRAAARAANEQAQRQQQAGESSSSVRSPVASSSVEDVEDERRLAEAHLRAARELDDRVQQACASIPVAERMQCSVVGRASTQVLEVQDGVRITFAAGGPNAEQTALRARCVNAEANDVGREQMPACPLAIRALAVSARDTPTGVVLTLTTRDAGSVAELRRRARAMPPAR